MALVIMVICRSLAMQPFSALRDSAEIVRADDNSVGLNPSAIYSPRARPAPINPPPLVAPEYASPKVLIRRFNAYQNAATATMEGHSNPSSNSADDLWPDDV